PTPGRPSASTASSRRRPARLASARRSPSLRPRPAPTRCRARRRPPAGASVPSSPSAAAPRIRDRGRGRGGLAGLGPAGGPPLPHPPAVVALVLAQAAALAHGRAPPDAVQVVVEGVAQALGLDQAAVADGHGVQP